MRIITAVLFIDDTSDPPTAGLSIDVDGNPKSIEASDVPPADLITALQALGQVVGVDLKPLVDDRILSVVGKLEVSVTAGEERQAARVQALQDWQKAAA